MDLAPGRARPIANTVEVCVGGQSWGGVTALSARWVLAAANVAAPHCPAPILAQLPLSLPLILRL